MEVKKKEPSPLYGPARRTSRTRRRSSCTARTQSQQRKRVGEQRATPPEDKSIRLRRGDIAETWDTVCTIYFSGGHVFPPTPGDRNESLKFFDKQYNKGTNLL